MLGHVVHAPYRIMLALLQLVCEKQDVEFDFQWIGSQWSVLRIWCNIVIYVWWGYCFCFCILYLPKMFEGFVWDSIKHCNSCDITNEWINCAVTYLNLFLGGLCVVQLIMCRVADSGNLSFHIHHIMASIIHTGFWLPVQMTRQWPQDGRANLQLSWSDP